MGLDNNNVHEDDLEYCQVCGVPISEEEGDNMDLELCIGCDHD